MVYCPECGKPLEFIDLSLYYCRNCKTFYIVHIGEHYGDVKCVCSTEPIANNLIERVLKNEKTKEDS